MSNLTLEYVSSGAIGYGRSLALYNDYLFYVTSVGICRINLLNQTEITYVVNTSAGSGYADNLNLAIDPSGYLYTGAGPIYRHNIKTVGSYTVELNWFLTAPTGSVSSIYYYNNYLYLAENNIIYRINTIGIPSKTIFYTHSTNYTISALIHYNGFMYFTSNNDSTLYKISITNPVAGSANNVIKYYSTDGYSVAGTIVIKNNNMYFILYGPTSSAYYLKKINLLTPQLTNYFMSNAGVPQFFYPSGGAIYNGYYYMAGNFLPRVTLPFEPSPPSNLFQIDAGNTISTGIGNLKVVISDPTNSVLNNVYYWYSINNNAYANTFIKANVSLSPYTFYVPNIPDISNTIYVKGINTLGNSDPPASAPVIVFQRPRVPPIFDVSFVGSGNIQVTVGESNPPPTDPYYYLNNVSYVAYLYSGGTNQLGNLSYYTYNVGVLANTNTTYGNVVSYIPNLPANTYTVYLAAKNAFGNSLANTVSKTITIYTSPGNVSLTGSTVAAGNLLVSITDTNNTSLVNNVYYLYSIDGTNFTNSNILAGSGTSPYNLYLNLPDISNTIFVKATNPVGNSSTVNEKTLVYQTPRVPPLFGVSFVGSGNIQITVGESNPPPNDTYYYLNNVSYVAYLYTGGDNQSGNLSYYTCNVGVLANTNTTYGNVVSYISGLSANTYTVYLAARNTVGNTIYANTNLTVSVYTVPNPPVIDQANTLSRTSGNLTVSFTDVTNTNINNVRYSYYLHDYDPSIQVYYV